MICVYNPFERDGLTLGAGVLSPVWCQVREEAGGPYSLTLRHPLTPDGVWKAIVPMSLLRVPVPACEVPAVNTETNSVVDAGWQVWQVARDGAGFYASTASVRYPAFVNGNMYVRGDRVRNAGRNWECITAATLLTPSAANGASWRDLGTGDPSPGAYLPRGEQLAVSDAGDPWLEAKRRDGTRGYVRRADCVYLYTADEGAAITDPVEANTLTDQLFRVTDVTVDSAAGLLTAHALHLSYDANGILLDSVTFADTDLPTAAAALRTAALRDAPEGVPGIFCQTADTVDGSFTRRSLTAALLDPEKGLVRQSRTRLVRDDRDFFLLANDPADRGLRLVHGANLRGVRWTRDCSRLVTRLCPVASAADGTDLPLPERSVDSPRLSRYPVIASRPLRTGLRVGRNGLTEADALSAMRAAAARRFAEGIDLPTVTLTVDFLMLGDTEEFRQYKGLERLNLYDTVEIYHPDLGLHTRAQVKSYRWDAIGRRYTRITLGDAFEPPAHTVYGFNVADGEIGAEKLTPEAIATIRNG